MPQPRAPLPPMPVIKVTWVLTGIENRSETPWGWRPNPEVMEWLIERSGGLHTIEFHKDGDGRVGFTDPDLALEYRMRWS